MTVESNFAIAIAALSDWFKNLEPVANEKQNQNQDQSQFVSGMFPAL